MAHVRSAKWGKLLLVAQVDLESGIGSHIRHQPARFHPARDFIITGGALREYQWHGHLPGQLICAVPFALVAKFVRCSGKAALADLLRPPR
jgi:hypothetical protein